MPKFVIDEDMPRSTAKHLDELGYDAKDVRDVGLRGAKDDTVFAFTQSNEAVLLSLLIFQMKLVHMKSTVN
ncbi:DUF5615 family PIN-like protein [Candidatus Aquicultor secundus]|uniref:DUF5615 family PIN-like protein n=1 Tax=Candidatus Aquicultor secundus TaxID=1973895 RepID=UPI000CB57014|nr:MAG: hypothetical protein COZ03_04075 [Candidatus Aquicultor secundus]